MPSRNPRRPMAGCGTHSIYSTKNGSSVPQQCLRSAARHKWRLVFPMAHLSMLREQALLATLPTILLRPTAFPVTSAFDLNAPADFSGGTKQLVTQAQANTLVSLPGASPWTVGNFPLDPHFKDARSHQWHIQVQREITPETLFSIAYAGSNNGRLDYKGKPNTAPQAFPAGTPADAIDALRPMPWVSANINYEQSIGYSRYNALETSLHHRVW